MDKVSEYLPKLSPERLNELFLESREKGVTLGDLITQKEEECKDARSDLMYEWRQWRLAEGLDANEEQSDRLCRMEEDSRSIGSFLPNM